MYAVPLSPWHGQLWMCGQSLGYYAAERIAPKVHYESGHPTIESQWQDWMSRPLAAVPDLTPLSLMTA